jgi:hypothetical protein
VTPREFLVDVLRPACAILGPRYSDPRAEVAITAICLQETGLRTRKQIMGPARGLAQFEEIGVRGVLTHPASSSAARGFLAANRLPRTLGARAILSLFETDDILCAGFARLNLWTEPKPLPALGDVEGCWKTYLRTWRPGRPHHTRWPDNYARARAALNPPLPG